MEFGILGPLAVWEDGRELAVGPPRQRAVLALLLLRRGELVPTATIVDLLWSERPPPTATKTVQVYVSQLRKALGADVVETQPLGYSLRVEAGTLDLDRFEELVGRARRLLGEGDAEQAAEVLREALALWRGPPLADFRYDAFARDETARLEELRLAAGELRLEAELALGRHVEAVPELEALVREHPLRESLRGLLMLALYRAGRQADALAAYKDARTTLVEELGIEPSESLQQLETAILRHDPALDLPGPVGAQGAPAVPPTTAGPEPVVPEQAPGRAGRRRLVVVLGCGALVATSAVIATAVLLTQGGHDPAAAVVSADSVGVFKAGNGRPSGQIPVGASPSAIAAGAGSIWVANGDAHSVSRVNPDKQVTIETIPVGNGPAGIAFGGGSTWVSNSLDNTVSRINAQTNTEVQKVTVGNGPAGVAVDSRYVWVANSHDGTVTRIDRRTGKPLKPIPSGQSADGVAVGYGSIWVTSALSGTVTRIDARSGSVLRSIQAGNGANAVAVGLGSVWIANSLDGTVTRIDQATNTVRATIAVGDGPNGIAVADGAVWVSNELSGTLTKIDPLRNIPIQTVTTGNRPEGIAIESGSLFVAVRASGAGHRGGTLTVLTSSGYLVHVDPALVFDAPENQVAVLTRDGLTGFRRVGGNAGLALVPDLAISLPTPTDGGRSYSFQLRPGIHYSTGALVRPQDFRRAIERTLELAPEGAFYAPYYAGIVGARRCLAAPKKPCDLSQGIETHAGSDTISFHLTSPDADFLYKLDLPSAFAVPAGTPRHPRGFLPATGPYEIASFDPKRGIRLVRNPRFREWSPAAQPSGFPDTIVERVRGSSDSHVAAVLRGAADLASGETRPSPAVIASVQTQHPSQLELNPLVITYFLALNTRVKPFDDVRVRRALNLAVDRQRLLDLAFGRGVGQVTCQVLPPGLLGYRRYCPYTAKPNATGTWTASDPTRARELVRASGTTGQAVTVWMPRGIPHFDAAAGRYVVSVLDSLGFNARLRFTGQNVATHDQVVFSGWLPDYQAPAGMVSPITCDAYKPIPSENVNYAGFCDRAIDRKIAQARSLETSDPEVASRLWAKVDRNVTDKAPWVSFANGVAVDIKSTRVRNYQFNPQWGTLLGQLWVK